MKKIFLRKSFVLLTTMLLLVGGFFVANTAQADPVDGGGGGGVDSANLILTVPATTTITRSTLVPETSGVPTAGNAAVDTAIIGLTPIAVTLANIGDAASANVRISPIGAGPNIQLWAKDTSGNWFDINVTGWIDSTGISVLAGDFKTTDVYAISDTTVDYPLTVQLVNAVGGTLSTSKTGTVTVAPIIHTQDDFAAFDGVDIGTNAYTFSSGITATYTGGTGTADNPVLLKLTGYAPIVTPWFESSWKTYNYVTIGIKLPARFTETSVYDAGVMRYNPNPSGIYDTGEGSTLLATTGAAKGYLDFSFAANSTNTTTKDGLVKLEVIWTAGGTPEYFTIDISGVQMIAAADALAFTNATAAVVKAEDSKLQADVDAAQTLVTALPDGAAKTDLQNRINSVKVNRGSSGSRPVTPAIPATPAVPGISPAIPATPAVPAGKVLGAEKFNFTKFLKFKAGSYKVSLQGTEVTELQNFLTTLGYTLVADGKFGPLTEGAVIKFQIAKGLKGDGVVGALTREALNK